MLRTIFSFAVLLAVAAPLHGADYYVDPAHGDPANDGTAASPWRSLQEVIDAGLVESRTWESLPYKKGSKLVPKTQGQRSRPATRSGCEAATTAT